MLKRPKYIGTRMSYAEIEKRFDSEWVLLENPETTKMLKVKRGLKIYYIDRIEAIEQVRSHFSMLCHAVPATSSVDGVLGLNFLRGKRLTIDFRKGLITLK